MYVRFRGIGAGRPFQMLDRRTHIPRRQFRLSILVIRIRIVGLRCQNAPEFRHPRRFLIEVKQRDCQVVAVHYVSRRNRQLRTELLCGLLQPVLLQKQ